MNSINKIGKIVLTKLLDKKTSTHDGVTRIFNLIFKEDKIKLDTPHQETDFQEGKWTTHSVWGMELGLFDKCCNFSEERTLLQNITESIILHKRDYAPTHYIREVTTKTSTEVSTEYFIYRIRSWAETVIFNDYISPATWERLEKEMEDSDKEHEIFCQEYEQSLLEDELIKEQESEEDTDETFYDNQSDEEIAREEEEQRQDSEDHFDELREYREQEGEEFNPRRIPRDIPGNPED